MNHLTVSGTENSTGYKINVHRVKPGTIYQDANLKVMAFAVRHGSWAEAYGYRFDTSDKSIVCSGDTAPAQSVVEACHGCDVLIHEVYSGSGGIPGKNEEVWMKYMASFHTSAEELAVIATRANAKALVLTHYIFLGCSNETEMVDTIKKKFAGTVIVARDLDVIAP
jgi:ribonuclease Z